MTSLPYVGLLVKALLAYVGTISLWRFYKRFLAKKPFADLRGPRAQSWITGNHMQIFGARGWDFHRHISETYGGAVPVWNILGSQQLYIFDPLALNVVFLRDQDFYERSPLLIGIGYLILGNGLLNSSGETHRRQRKMMTPVFSTAHLRHMVPFFYDVMNRLQATFEKKLRRDGTQELEILQWMARAALELIGRGGLGVSFDPLTEEAQMHTYSQIIKELIPTITPLQAIGYLIFPWGMEFATPQFRRKIVDFLSMFWPRLKKARDMIDLMYNTSVKIYDDKQRAFLEGDEAVAKQVSNGKDIMGILMRNNHEAPPEDKLPEDEIIAQMSTMIFAATDTTSGGMARLMHLLATHQDVQERLRAEVAEAREKFGHRELNYDELNNLPYLDAIVRETLRLHPPVTAIQRTTNTDMMLPLSKPIIDKHGNELREVFVPRDTDLVISIISSNRNKAIWGDDAEEWKPERWLKPLPDSLINAKIPGTTSHLMTFLGGSRGCVGFKFSQIEIKVALSILLEKFKVDLSEKEIRWDMNLITNPMLADNSSTRPQMPLIFSLLEPAK